MTEYYIDYPRYPVITPMKKPVKVFIASIAKATFLSSLLQKTINKHAKKQTNNKSKQQAIIPAFI